MSYNYNWCSSSNPQYSCYYYPQCSNCCCYSMGLAVKPQVDEDEQFFESLLPYVKCLNIGNQLKTRIMIDEMMFNIIYKEPPTMNEFSLCKEKYVPSKDMCNLDPDEKYFYSLIPRLKDLSYDKKLQVRTQINEIIRGILKDQTEQSKKLFKEKYSVLISRDNLRSSL